MQILHLIMSTDRRQTFANHFSRTAKFLSVYSKKHKSRR